MFDPSQLLAAIRLPLLGALATVVSFALYRHLCPIFRDLQHPPEEYTFTPAKARIEAEQKERLTKPPYLTDAFPGGRHFETVYGTIQVFEWGPEEGEKVLMVHGLGTPCIALGDMAKEFVSKGYRVMLFDLFGRGYSDAPNDLKYDARLYTTQVLLVLSSSPLPWTGSSAFHIVGFSLGGSIAVAFGAYHAHMLRSMTLVCPGGLIRTSLMSRRSQFIYSSRIIPEWLRLKYIHSSVEPRKGALCTDLSETHHMDVDFDEVPIAADQPRVRIGDVIRWQLEGNPGFVAAYWSTILSALVYRRHDRVWRVLSDELARRRGTNAPPGLPGGRICLVLAERDITVVKDDTIEDIQTVLCIEDVEVNVMKGGHEIAISRGKDVASLAMQSWNRQR
ncbi:putative alpha/beta fold family hydrolase [Xylariaceae sp. AK1471]|nr:putative alpha/beta fold family hydrolase [Xylariaceae sp. AK1471]